MRSACTSFDFCRNSAADKMFLNKQTNKYFTWCFICQVNQIRDQQVMKAVGGEINSSNRYLKSKWDRSKGLISVLTHTGSLIYTCLINCELTLS